MTRTVIRDTIRKKLGETTAVFWTDAILNQWIEDAQLDIVWKAKCNRQRSLVTTVASTVRYTLSSLVTDILRIFRVRVYNATTVKWERLTLKTEEELDREYPSWENADAGTPMFYMYDTELDEFILYPKADSNYVGTSYLEIYNSSKPTVMTADSNSPDLPVTLQQAVVDYVVAVGLETRGYQDIANTHWGAYYSKIKSHMIEKGFEEDREIIMRKG